MANSYRTEKESAVAERRVHRDVDGEPLYPRVIVRRPTAGDIHPLSKSTIQRLFRRIPLKYLYGLRQIELKARLNNEIGSPFARYSDSEKRIELFSLPLEWRLDSLGPFFQRELSRFYPVITEDEGGVRVRWEDGAMMGLWYYCSVLIHELDHHYREQYRHKNGAQGRRRDEELVAELHAQRFTEELFRSHRSRTKTV